MRTMVLFYASDLEDNPSRGFPTTVLPTQHIEHSFTVNHWTGQIYLNKYRAMSNCYEIFPGVFMCDYNKYYGIVSYTIIYSIGE